MSNLESSAVVTVVGAGLAGSECAWQLAERGVNVRLLEQKPKRRTPAQQSDFFAELVCSNSFRGAGLANAVGLLKMEMLRAGSLIMQVGLETRVPAGGAFAVDRERFGPEVTRRLHEHPRIEVVCEEVDALPKAPEAHTPWVIATGPLTTDALAADLAATVGQQHLAYYDAIAPVVVAESIRWDEVFEKSRYDKGGTSDYINCPMDEATYDAFIAALLAADVAGEKEFEKLKYFEGCLPIEVMASRGRLTLAYGPMKPVGLEDPETGIRPFAVVQLRAENRARTSFNLVGFQTRMKWPEQKKVLRMIPGLQDAEFERLGSVHRNTFVNAPEVLDPETLALKARPNVYLAGQVSGVEGYIESAGCGLVIGAMLGARLHGETWAEPPVECALGALLTHLRTPRPDFQPSNVVWSLVPPLKGRRIRKRRERREKLGHRALEALEPWLDASGAREVQARFEPVPDAALFESESEAAAKQL